MSRDIRSLISAIAKDNFAEADNKFESIFASKARVQLDDVRKKVAKEKFNQR